MAALTRIAILLSFFCLSASAQLRSDTSRNLVETPDKDLYGCASHFSCGDSTLHFASVSQVVADPESHYASLSLGTSLCEQSFETVLLLGNVEGCQQDIQSVKFVLTYPSEDKRLATKRMWTENKWPYTVFRDEDGIFESRKLGPGHYMLNVKIYDVNSCLLVDRFYEFDINSMEACEKDAVTTG